MDSMIQPDFPFLSVPEAAVALGLTGARIRQLLIAEEMRGHKLGSQNWAIPPSEIERYQQNRRPRGKPKNNR